MFYKVILKHKSCVLFTPDFLCTNAGDHSVFSCHQRTFLNLSLFFCRACVNVSRQEVVERGLTVHLLTDQGCSPKQIE